MSNARSVLSIAAQAAAAYFTAGQSLWVQAAAVGAAGAIGGAIGASIDGPIENSEKIADLSSPKIQYGAKWPRIYGRQRVTAFPLWFSDKRPVAHTTEAGGKGGPSSEFTSYTYELDALLGIADGTNCIGISRVWLDGVLVWVALSTASAESLAASDATDKWAALTFMDGNAAQVPWNVYEAAVGATNAVAYRHRCTIGISSLQMPTERPPIIEVEVLTAGTFGDVGANTRLRVTFDAGDGDDTSEYNHTPVLVGGFSYTPSGFAESDLGTAEASVTWSSADLAFDQASGVTLEAQGTLVFGGSDDVVIGAYTSGSLFIIIEVVAQFPTGFKVRVSTEASGATIIGATYPLGTMVHVACVRPAGASPTVRVYIDGSLSATLSTSVISPAPSSGSGYIRRGLTGIAGQVSVDFMRITWGEAYTTNFAPPSSATLPGADSGYSTVTPGTVDLGTIVSAECLRAGLSASDIDVSELSGTDAVEVTGIAATGSARALIEQLMSTYYFEAACSDKIYFPRRAGASAASIPYANLGASFEEANREAFNPERANDLELPAQVTFSYPNLSADYEAGTESSPRLTGSGDSILSVQSGVVLTPPEAKARAESLMRDIIIAATSVRLQVSDYYADLYPTKVITATDGDGTSYRLRLTRENYTNGVKEFDAVLDDQAALTTIGITSELNDPVISVTAYSGSDELLMDIPILRDADDEAGFYAAVRPTDPSMQWPGAQLRKSPDDVTFEEVATYTDRSVYGATAGALGDWTAGDMWDEVNSVQVDIGAGNTLTSSTRAAMLLDSSINAAAIGTHGAWEIIQFRTATQDDDGVYTLSGFLRGRRGTEWATAGHAAGDYFALLRLSGLRRVASELEEAGLARYYRAVTFGKLLGSEVSQSFTNEAVGLKPFAPVDVRIARDTSGNITITWKRRTRLADRFGGTLGDSVPLGEDSEAYEVDVYANDSDDTIVRTISATSQTASYSAADQTTDFGSAQSSLRVGVFQISAQVGRGYEAEATA